MGYHALLSVIANNVQWKLAIHIFEDMYQTGVNPDISIYNNVLDIIWERDKKNTNDVFRRAIEKKIFGNFIFKSKKIWRLNLQDFSVGAGCVAVIWWLAEHVSCTRADSNDSTVFIIMTTRGTDTQSEQSFLRSKLSQLLHGIHVTYQKMKNAYYFKLTKKSILL